MTIRLSPPVARSFEPEGDICSYRHFRHTDFPQGMSPLVLVDHFVMTGPAVAPHPHAGMSTVTLLLEDTLGGLRIRDSLDNEHEARAGDLHWTVAGRGVVHGHQLVDAARLNGLRLYVNLPERLKSLPPSATLVKAWEMPVLQSDAGRVRVVAGRYEGWAAPLETPEPLLILDGWLRPGASRLVPLPAGWNAWLYAVRGELGVRARHDTKPARPPPAAPPPMPVARFRAGARAPAAARRAIDPDFAILQPGAALTAMADREGLLQLLAAGAPVHFILVAGPAIDEPVIQRGPFIMTDTRALAQAVAAYEAGQFGRLRGETVPPG
ncbi:pirin family protein [Achromobacter ruhlandii]|uniref:pirin family protein n=1 Tax=Achromobacter ruhlandii TaxID=72557 RepID=UPI0007BF0C62|nr:pirin-like C-terminal cupin domain-containing protein [Achromobacter ruhlandii]